MTTVNKRKQVAQNSSIRKPVRRAQIYCHIYRVSLTKLRVPKEDARSSRTRSLSFRCTCISVSNPACNSGFSTMTSACIRRKTFWNVWTASKSRRDFSLCVSATTKVFKLSSITRDRSSTSMAAGERVFAKLKKSSSNRILARFSGMGNEDPTVPCDVAGC